MLLAANPELPVLLLHEVRLGQQRIYLGLVCEIARRVDAAELDGALPKRLVLGVVLEARHVSRTETKVNSTIACADAARGCSHGQGPDAAGVPAHDVVGTANLCAEELARLIEGLESGDPWSACDNVQLTNGGR